VLQPSASVIYLVDGTTIHERKHYDAGNSTNPGWRSWAGGWSDRREDGFLITSLSLAHMGGNSRQQFAQVRTDDDAVFTICVSPAERSLDASTFKIAKRRGLTRLS